jgi:LacI family transcriptional regulator
VRSTLTDIARDSGVSTATVDRVLNNRAGVSSRTRAIVMETATRLGYFGQTEPAVERIRLDFVLPEGTNTFIAHLKAQLARQCAVQDGIDYHLHAVEGFNPLSLAQKLASLRSVTQGVGLVALDHPAVREELRALAEAGVKVVTLASDILHVARTGYIGIDNRAAGRLGGYLLGRLLPATPGKIALFAGSLSYRGHEEREMGFRHIISEEFRHLEIVQMREIRDDRQRAYEETLALLDRHPDLAGIYNIGGGSSGIGKALDDRGRGRSIVFIGHELTDNSKPLLLSGTMDAVIDQNPRVEAREAIGLLASAIRGKPFEEHPPRLQVIFRENIPEY